MKYLFIIINLLFNFSDITIAFSQVNVLTLEKTDPYTVSPFSGFWKNSGDCFTGKNSLYHFSGLAATTAIITTGLDKEVHNFFVRNRGVEPYSTPGVYLGYAVPVLLGGGLLAYGLLEKSDKDKTAASAVLQACAVSLVYSSALKFFTGRPNPDPVEYLNNDYASTFRFGLNRGGVHYGWPSGHMITNTAMVTSLLSFYPDNTTLNIIGYAYLGYLFLSVISHDKSTMHWFSDAVTGTIMGYAIGKTIGKNFRERYNSYNNKLNWMINSSPVGCSLSFAWNF